MQALLCHRPLNGSAIFFFFFDGIYCYDTTARQLSFLRPFNDMAVWLTLTRIPGVTWTCDMLTRMFGSDTRPDSAVGVFAVHPYRTNPPVTSLARLPFVNEDNTCLFALILKENVQFVTVFRILVFFFVCVCVVIFVTNVHEMFLFLNTSTLNSTSINLLLIRGY